jgi:hypothetical protein
MSERAGWVTGRRVLVVLPVVPWMLFYGVAGGGLVALAVKGVATGAGSVRVTTDANLDTWLCLLLGLGLVLALAVLVATALLLLAGNRDSRYWVPVIGAAFVVLVGSIVWVAAMQLEPGESITLWALGFWPMAAVPALLVGHRFETLRRSTF